MIIAKFTSPVVGMRFDIEHSLKMLFILTMVVKRP